MNQQLPTIAAATAAISAAAAAAAITTAAASATTAATAATFAWSLRTSFGYDHRATIEICAVKRVDSFVRRSVVRHFDKSESLRSAALAIHNDFSRIDSADCTELRLKPLLSCRKRKVADIQFLAHSLS
jgi:hypothetical protein